MPSVARRELGRGQAHVAAEADAQLAGRLAGEVAEHWSANARPTASATVAVDLLAVQAADVVGLEISGGALGAISRGS